MTVTARRIYYLSAFLVFAVLGPLIVMWTDGYRWVGWQTGFQQVGALYISSEPRAMLYVDQQLIGQTPQRFTHLKPGSHTVELRAQGTTGWQQVIAIRPDTATVIGPVTLFPAHFTVSNSTLPNTSHTIIDQQTSTAFQFQPVEGDWRVSELWPLRAETYSLNFEPTSVQSSPDGRFLYFANTIQASVIDRNQPTYAWTFPAPSAVHWDPTSAGTLFGIVAGHIVRYDVISKSFVTFSPASSFVLFGSDVWIMQQTPTETVILKQHAFGQTVPSVAMRLTGSWVFTASPPGTLLMENTQTHEYEELHYDAITNQITPLSLGIADAIWWHDKNSPPIWVSGVDIFSLDAREQPLLLDRVDRAPVTSQWIVPNHLLLTYDGQTVTISSVSSRQGRGVVLQETLPNAASLIAVDPVKQNLTLVTTQQPAQLLVLSW